MTLSEQRVPNEQIADGLRHMLIDAIHAGNDYDWDEVIRLTLNARKLVENGRVRIKS